MPQLSIDSITLTLLIIAILPWIAPLVKSIELPGGTKIEFQDLEKLQRDAIKAGLLKQKKDTKKEETIRFNIEPTSKQEKYSFQLITNGDSTLALAGLRIELEKRLKQLAELNNIIAPKGIKQLVDLLENAKVLTQQEKSVFSDLTNLLNKAVHGASIDSQTSDWALEIGTEILETLDARLNNI